MVERQTRCLEVAMLSGVQVQLLSAPPIFLVDKAEGESLFSSEILLGVETPLENR